MKRLGNKKSVLNIAALCLCVVIVGSCASADVPGARGVSIPSPTMADPRPEAINEQPESVLYLPLGSDVLVPEAGDGEGLPTDMIGPYELRSETLAGALQLILADYDIPLAFETDEGLDRTITVANLRGPLNSVVEKVCGLADLYCSFEDGIIVIKETQTFTVTVPPIGGDTDFLGALAGGLAAIIGTSPVTESATRTIVYEATQRTARMAERYLQRIRSNTALIVFEIYIWEVALNSDNDTGINWEDFGEIGGMGINLPGALTADVTPISIGLPRFGEEISYNTDNILQFLSTYGAVKTISQPQITVLSGAEATLRAADTVNYVSSLSRSVDNGEVTVSTETDSVDTGFTLTIASNWDSATIYGNINIALQEFQDFDDFVTEGATLRLPITTERELTTQIRIRPGDSLLIAGLVRERDAMDRSGPGFDEVLFPTSRSAGSSNTELVFLLKPKVIVYTDEGVPDKNKTDIDPALSGVLSRAEEGFPEGSLPKDLLNPSLAPVND